MIKKFIRKLKLRLAIRKYRNSINEYDEKVSQAYSEWRQTQTIPKASENASEDILTYQNILEVWWSSRPTLLKKMDSLRSRMKFKLIEMEERLND